MKRCIEFKGTYNFRDLGGYSSRNGYKTKWGMVFRSDHLGNLTSSDLARFEKLNIRLILDTRTAEERVANPNRLPSANPPRSLNFEIEVGNYGMDEIKRRILSGKMEGLDLHEELIQNYRKGVSTYGKEIMVMLKLLCDPANLPVLIHCNSGKDRTGIACAMLLKILGVKRETIFEDYLLSAARMEKMVKRLVRKVRIISWFRADTAQLRHMLSTREEFLQAAFDEMIRLHGSVDKYFRSLGLTNAMRAQLRKNLCE